MDTRLLRKLRKEALNTYGVEKRGTVFAVVSYSPDDYNFKDNSNAVIALSRDKADAITKCDKERTQYIYLKFLKIRASKPNNRRIY